MRKTAMKSVLITAALIGVVLAGIALADSAVTIKLPPDAKQFGPGAGQSLAQAKCTV
jgi:mono/diheme cytochrome c family protein